jgi:hypothetical protein
MHSGKVFMAVACSLLTATASRAAGTCVPIASYSNAVIQTNLISQFPVGLFTPATTFSPAATFKIPKAKSTGLHPTYNFWQGSYPQQLTLNVSVSRATYVYTLINAYGPPAGQIIATVEFKGSNGADQTFSLSAGTDIRDFCVTNFANTINGTTTQNAFEVDGVQNGCATGNVKTGLNTNYRIDEQKFTLLPAFTKQKLTQIIITPTGVGGSRPIVLGVTVVH